MSQFRAKRIRFKNGERHSVLLRPNGMPVHEAALFLLKFRTKGRSSKTIHTVCTSISIVHNNLTDVDLIERFKTGQFLTSSELARLEIEAQYWVSEQSEDDVPRAKSKVISIHTVNPKSRITAPERDQVELPTRAARLRYIANYLEFLALTLPSSQTAIWMLLRWRTPPGKSEVLLLPVRNRLIATSLFPNAARNSNGNSCALKVARARSVTADSISTAFIFPAKLCF